MGTRHPEPDFSGQRSSVRGHGYDREVMINAGMEPGKAMRVLEVSLVCSLLVVFAALAVSVTHMRRIDGDLRREQIASCERDNTARHQINMLSAKAGLEPIRILDCRQIFK